MFRLLPVRIQGHARCTDRDLRHGNGICEEVGHFVCGSRKLEVVNRGDGVVVEVEEAIRRDSFAWIWLF